MTPRLGSRNFFHFTVSKKKFLELASLLDDDWLKHYFYYRDIWPAFLFSIIALVGRLLFVGKTSTV